MLFDCAFPDSFTDYPTCMNKFLASTRLIVRTMYDSLMNNVDNSLNYLFIYNRLTRAWTSPIPFPEEYGQFRTFSVKGVAIVEPRTVVALCRPWRECEFTLVCFAISEDLDALTVISRAQLGRHQILKACKLFPTSHGFTVVLRSSHSSPFGESKRETLVCDFEGAGMTSVERYPISCACAMSYNGSLYFVHDDDVSSDLALCRRDGALLSPISSFSGRAEHKQFMEHRGWGLQLMTSGSRIYSIVSCFLTEISALVFDIDTQQWQQFQHRSSLPLSEFRNGLNAYPVSDSGEMLLSASYEDTRRRRTLRGYRSRWLQPPPLSTLAVRVLHKNLPNETADSLEHQRGIGDEIQLLKFLHYSD